MAENQNEELAIIDILMDDSIDEITLVDDSGRETKFYNYGIIIPYTAGDEPRIYTILEPKDKVEGVEEGEGLVFRVYTEEQDGKDDIETENDEKIIKAVFEAYESLIED